MIAVVISPGNSKCLNAVSPASIKGPRSIDDRLLNRQLEIKFPPQVYAISKPCIQPSIA
jgi:hypothetical protein